MTNIVEMLYKQVEVAVEDHWDAKLIAENNPSLINEQRVQETYADVVVKCRIRDKYIMNNVL